MSQSGFQGLRMANHSPRLWCWILVSVVVFVATAIIGCSRSTENESLPATTKGEPNGIHVTVAVQFHGQGDDLVREIEMKSGQSVIDALMAAVGGDVVYSGSRETLFVSAIKGVANGGAGADNWTFRVNDKLGGSSCGVVVLNDGDRLLWNYGDYSPSEDGKSR
jgi:hypothetical protein